MAKWRAIGSAAAGPVWGPTMPMKAPTTRAMRSARRRGASPPADRSGRAADGSRTLPAGASALRPTLGLEGQPRTAGHHRSRRRAEVLLAHLGGDVGGHVAEDGAHRAVRRGHPAPP